MAFEARKSAGPFFYLGYRDPATGAVRKRYFGRGGRAREAAAALASRQREREADRRAVGAARDALRDLDALTAELDGAAAVLMEAVLLAGGWHRPNYGPWRRKRDGYGGHGAGPGGGRAG
jgi:hypothetical protein